MTDTPTCCGHCTNGVNIDVDEFHEGWMRDTNYPLAPCHPGYCKPCQGTGTADGGDCEACGGTGNTLGENDSQERLAAAADENAALEG